MADLITKSDYKNYSNINGSNDDSKIEILVTSVSSFIKNYCGTSFIDYYTVDKTEYFDINDVGTTCVFLDESPLVSITSVSERGSLAEAYVLLVADGTGGKYEYVTNDSLGIINRTNSTGSVAFPVGFKSVEVVYKSGYASTPEDLKLAAYDLVTYYLKQEYKVNKTILNSSITNPSGNSVDNDSGFPDHIKRVLDMYRVDV